MLKDLGQVEIQEPTCRLEPQLGDNFSAPDLTKVGQGRGIAGTAGSQAASSRREAPLARHPARTHSSAHSHEICSSGDFCGGATPSAASPADTAPAALATTPSGAVGVSDSVDDLFEAMNVEDAKEEHAARELARLGPHGRADQPSFGVNPHKGAENAFSAKQDAGEFSLADVIGQANMDRLMEHHVLEKPGESGTGSSGLRRGGGGIRSGACAEAARSHSDQMSWEAKRGGSEQRPQGVKGEEGEEVHRNDRMEGRPSNGAAMGAPGLSVKRRMAAMDEHGNGEVVESGAAAGTRPKRQLSVSTRTGSGGLAGAAAVRQPRAASGGSGDGAHSGQPAGNPEEPGAGADPATGTDAQEPSLAPMVPVAPAASVSKSLPQKRKASGIPGAEEAASTGGKATTKVDKHSKVETARGWRDRRVRLSSNAAVAFYDVQDRLGMSNASQALEWLLEQAASSIAQLPKPGFRGGVRTGTTAPSTLGNPGGASSGRPRVEAVEAAAAAAGGRAGAGMGGMHAQHRRQHAMHHHHAAGMAAAAQARNLSAMEHTPMLPPLPGSGMHSASPADYLAAGHGTSDYLQGGAGAAAAAAAAAAVAAAAASTDSSSAGYQRMVAIGMSGGGAYGSLRGHMGGPIPMGGYSMSDGADHSGWMMNAGNSRALPPGTATGVPAASVHAAVAAAAAASAAAGGSTGAGSTGGAHAWEEHESDFFWEGGNLGAERYMALSDGGHDIRDGGHEAMMQGVTMSGHARGSAQQDAHGGHIGTAGGSDVRAASGTGMSNVVHPGGAPNPGPAGAGMPGASEGDASWLVSDADWKNIPEPPMDAAGMLLWEGSKHSLTPGAGSGVQLSELATEQPPTGDAGGVQAGSAGLHQSSSCQVHGSSGAPAAANGAGASGPGAACTGHCGPLQSSSTGQAASDHLPEALATQFAEGAGAQGERHAEQESRRREGVPSWHVGPSRMVDRGRLLLEWLEEGQEDHAAARGELEHIPGFWYGRSGSDIALRYLADDPHAGRGMRRGEPAGEKGSYGEGAPGPRDNGQDRAPGGAPVEGPSAEQKQQQAAAAAAAAASVAVRAAAAAAAAAGGPGHHWSQRHHQQAAGWMNRPSYIPSTLDDPYYGYEPMDSGMHQPYPMDLPPPAGAWHHQPGMGFPAGYPCRPGMPGQPAPYYMPQAYVDAYPATRFGMPGAARRFRGQGGAVRDVGQHAPRSAAEQHGAEG